MLVVHRAERADRLVDALAEVLAQPLPDPFAAEVVSVPAKGVERWLAQRLSHVLGSGPAGEAGVCANVVFPPPAALLGEALAGATGVPAETDPWAVDRLLWPLLEVIDGCATEGWCRALGAHLGLTGVAAPPGRRLAVARRLAGLFDRYGASRPALLTAWARGEAGDGAGGPLPDDLAWQPELWRRLRVHVAVPSPAERLADGCAALRAHPERVPLPQRLSLFGPTRLPAAHLAVLAALASGREVHLWAPHPSPDLWQRVQPHVTGARWRRADDPTAGLPRHPLLRSLGRDTRELQVALSGAATVDHRHHPLSERPPTLLGRLQADVAADRELTSDTGAGAGDAPLLDPDDDSVRVHACHGPARQVEVLREVLLGLLAADPTLEPRDVLVLCPDIEAFAPLVSAAFGLAGEVEGAEPAHPAHRLRVRLADRALRQVNPVLGVLAQLLDLADARLTASQVLDLAASRPVRRRFGLDDDDLERLRDLVARAGVRWGLDANDREPYDLQAFGQNTWRSGLDRLLLGVAMSEDEPDWLGLALPLDDVDSSDVVLVGRFSELVDRLHEALQGLTGQRPLLGWLSALATALDDLTDVPAADAWQATQARAELADLAAAADGHGDRALLGLADLRALLADRLQGRPTRAGFRTGSLTVCTMVPMRSVPHRVVVLLGLDDGVVPRNAVPDGDDVLARSPLVGDRDPRAEDRQLLLDAVLSATERLVVLYSGADERTNQPRPPAVPLGEILDALDRTATTGDGRPVRDHLVVRHPLQPFDSRNFRPGALAGTGPFSFDRSGLHGARAAEAPRTARPPFLPVPLPRPRTDTVALEDLARFVEHPVRAFLRQRVGVTPLDDEQEPDDALPVELDALQLWQVGDRILRARLAGLDRERCRQAEWRRGALPPGPLGARVLDDVLDRVEPLLAAAAPHRVGDPRAVDVLAELPAGPRVTGTVGGIHDETATTVLWSKVAAKHRLRAWVELLALTVGAPGPAWRAVVVGRGRNGVVRHVLGPLDPRSARDSLADLVDLHLAGLREPLPLPSKAAATYAAARANGAAPRGAAGAAERDWTGDWGEARDRDHRLVWGEDAPFDVLLASPADPGEAGGYDDHTRFGSLARRLWAPLLAAERQERP